MHPPLAVLAWIAGLVAFSLAWDHLFYVDPRDPQRRVRCRRNASADDQAIRCVHCLERIETRADLYAARNRYIPFTRQMLHARCARELAGTGHWKARRAGSWRRHLVHVTAIWVLFAAVGSALAPGIVRNGLWIPLVVAYAALLGHQLVFYLTVARRLPKTRRREEAPNSMQPPSAQVSSPVRGRPDLEEAMVLAAAGFIVMMIFAPGAAPSFGSLERVEGVVARTSIVARRHSRTLHLELRTGRGLLRLKHNTDHSGRAERQLLLPPGAPVTVWIAPRRLVARDKIWQLEYDGQLLLTYDDIVAARAVERVEFGTLTGVFLAVGLAIWLLRLFRPAPAVRSPQAIAAGGPHGGV